MMTPLDDWLAGLLLRLTPAERKAVNRRVMYQLRRGQAQRIASQKNPDGSPYEPRAKQKNLREKKGKIKRKAMFAKLRTQRFLTVRSDADAIEVGFHGRDSFIASRHQEGSSYRQNGKSYRMPQRVLLGLSSGEIETIADAYLDHLSGN